jgi:hypothetical protein
MECIAFGIVWYIKAMMLIWGAKRFLLHSNLQAPHTRFCDASTPSAKLVKTGEPITSQNPISVAKLGRACKKLNLIIGSF